VRPYYDRPLLESKHFEVWPSLGAFIEGWLLILPKAHQLSLAETTTTTMTELASVRRRVQRWLELKYGPVVAFEHGPSKWHTPVGCGVDHAHLHLVPFDGSLRETIAAVSSLPLRWRELAHLRNLASSSFESPYLFIEDAEGAFIATHEHLGSQLIRRALARSHHLEDVYEWARFPHLPNVRSTIESFEASEIAA
jgi:diadenosine tetraphosphate (Ap4A) HIT family hydrolase